MGRTIWLSALAAVVLVAGGCKQTERTPPAPQLAPVVAGQQDVVVKEKPHPAVTEKSTAAAVIPAPTASVQSAPVKTTKSAPTATVKSAAAVKTVAYKTSNGTVTFDHLRHAGNNSCSSCHPTEPPVKVVLDKDKAHQLCKGCHQQKGSGPTQCTGCHKKG